MRAAVEGVEGRALGVEGRALGKPFPPPGSCVSRSLCGPRVSWACAGSQHEGTVWQLPLARQHAGGGVLGAATHIRTRAGTC